jgi:tRNA-uridine 2-sulfurtransferase
MGGGSSITTLHLTLRVTMGKKVMVAMSGGVDSSVAAMLLNDEGYDVSGVTMCLGIAAEEDSARCCGAAAVDDAKRVCDRLKIPHFVFDYAGELEDKVIAKFISEYKKGRTPNPCVECNRYLKFGSLLDKAKALGFDFLATGHYAAIERNENGYFLKKAKDRKKDQTYFLYSMPYAGLENILFPLAALTKDEVREFAKKSFLSVAEKQESQDICFVTQKNYQQFLVERGQEFRPGPIVDMQGKMMGRHRGIIFHTIGQRGGLGISHPTPLYVVYIDPAANRIVVGEKKDLMAKGLVAGDINMLAQAWPRQMYAKIRYRKKEALCDVTAGNDRLRVIFAEEQEAITPGQSVVFYEKDRVLGGGTIEEVLHDKEQS